MISNEGDENLMYSLDTFYEIFPEEIDAIEYFIDIKYNDYVFCPHCGKMIEVNHRNDRPKLFNCRFCKNTFSIFKGTIFEKSDSDLRKWFYAAYSLLKSEKGFSAKQLQREIGVTYKTAWRMLNRIRSVMKTDNMRSPEDIDKRSLPSRKTYKFISDRFQNDYKNEFLFKESNNGKKNLFEILLALCA